MTKRVRERKTKKTDGYSSSQIVRNEYTNMLQIVGLVLAIFVVFFFITTLVTDKSTDANDEVTIQYDYIVVGEIFNKPESEYYVLATSDKDANDLYNLYISYYEQKDSYLKTYYIDLDDGFNSGYVTDKSNIFVSDLSKLRFKGATLLHVKDKKIDICYEGKEQLVIQYEKLIK
jgi:hypothetical protein